MNVKMMQENELQLTDDPTIIWVAPSGSGKGRGTIDDPFTDLNKAVERAQPGYTVMLKAGEYREDATFQKSGTINQPIRIRAQQGATVTVTEACWYFYDTSDLVVEDIFFRDAPFSALSVIGTCERNRFANLRFVNCGGTREQACAFFFGGDGGLCNLVESCSFEAPAPKNGTRPLSIGLMISEGEIDAAGTLNKNHILRNNSFVNLGCAIVVGSRGGSAAQYGHRIENNEIRNCVGDGIRVKCGDTLVRGNVIRQCGSSAVALASGSSSMIIDNRIEECGTGIHVLGLGHTIQNNCIVRCNREAVHVSASAEDRQFTASNILIEQNSCIACGQKASEPVVGVRCDPQTSAIIRRNLFWGEGQPYTHVHFDRNHHVQGQLTAQQALTAAQENAVSQGCAEVEGSSSTEVSFRDVNCGDYENSSEYGAHGWMAAGSVIPEEVQEDLSWAIQDMEDEASTSKPTEKYNEDIDPTEYFFKAGFYSEELPFSSSTETEEV
jgi:hypothetical protein